jgi:hypothetical protein
MNVHEAWWNVTERGKAEYWKKNTLPKLTLPFLSRYRDYVADRIAKVSVLISRQGVIRLLPLTHSVQTGSETHRASYTRGTVALLASIKHLE